MDQIAHQDQDVPGRPLGRRALLQLAVAGGLATVGLAACGAPPPTAAPQQPAAQPTQAPAKPTAAAATKPAEKPAATTAPAAATGPLKLAMHVPLTGASALFGQQIRDAAQMAFDEANARGGPKGRKLETNVEDSGGDNTVALNAFNKIVSGKPIAIIGSLVSTQLFAISPVLKDAKVPYVFSSTNTGVTRQGIEWLFRVTVHDEQRNRAGIRYLVDTLKRQKISSMHTNDEYGVGAAKVVADELKTRYNMDVVSDQSFSATDRDMTAQLVQIRNAGADAMMLNAFPQQAALVLKQFSQLGMKSQTTVMGDNGIVSPALLNLLEPDEADGLYGASAGVPQASTNQAVKDWIKKYEDLYKRPPDNYSANAYDGARMIIKTLEDGADTPDKVRAGLAGIKDFPGLMYSFTFDKFGDGVHEIIITKNEKRAPQILTTVKTEPAR